MTQSNPEEVGGCEHGEHPAVDAAGNRRVCEPNRRFCSKACADCEGTDFDTDTQCCAGLCGFPSSLLHEAAEDVECERLEGESDAEMIQRLQRTLGRLSKLVLRQAAGSLANFSENGRLLDVIRKLVTHEQTQHHGHEVHGVWDASNGPPSGGKPCAKCHLYAEARSLVGLPRWPTSKQARKMESSAREDRATLCEDANCGCGRKRRGE